MRDQNVVATSCSIDLSCVHCKICPSAGVFETWSFGARTHTHDNFLRGLRNAFIMSNELVFLLYEASF